MKKTTIVIIIISVVILISMSFCVGTGFNKRTDIMIFDYYVSQNRTKLTFNAQVMSSMGYTRGFKDSGDDTNTHYLTFYSTFGGLNSSFGSKSEFVLALDEDDTEIYFNRADGGYELVLQKNEETGEWVKP